MIRLAIFDVDGTLYSHKNHSVPKSAVEAIKQLRAQGILVAIASGRPVFVLQNIINAGVEFDYVVGCNGHSVYRNTTELLGGSYFNKQMIEDLANFCVENGYPLSWKFPYANYVYNKFEAFEDIHKNLKILRQMHEFEKVQGGPTLNVTR